VIPSMQEVAPCNHSCRNPVIAATQRLKIKEFGDALTELLIYHSNEQSSGPSPNSRAKRAGNGQHQRASYSHACRVLRFFQSVRLRIRTRLLVPISRSGKAKVS
jgi:hypothetical protein